MDCVLKYNYNSGYIIFINLKQPSALFPPERATSSANEFHRVLVTAEVGRFGTHYTKRGSGELL